MTDELFVHPHRPMVVMNILVVEPADGRRADLVDALCELPGIEVRASTSNAASSVAILAHDSIDAIVVGALSLMELTSLSVMSETHSAPLVSARSQEDLAGTLTAMAARRREGPSSSFGQLTARSKYLAFERNTAQAGPLALAHHLRTRADASTSPRGTQTLDLATWLPNALASMRTVLPEYIELSSLIAAETPHVSCDPAVLEHVILELVLQATTVLPWGGNVWVTVTPGDDGQVRLDVLENGRGRVLDLTLRAPREASVEI